MTTPLPGQRAAQHPMRAAISAQRSVGRTVNDNSHLSNQMLLNVGGSWMRLRVGEEGTEEMVPCDCPTQAWQ